MGCIQKMHKKRDQKIKSGAAASKMSKCKHYGILKFLQESVSTSAGESNIDFSQQNNIDSLRLSEDPNDASSVGSISTTSVQPYHKPSL